MKPLKGKKYEKVVKEAVKRFKVAVDADSDNRKLALDDIDFRNGDQWEDGVKRIREHEGRPCLTINKLEQRVDQVTGDQRMNRMGAVIRPLDSTNSYTERVPGRNFSMAEIYSGIIKNIESTSNAKSAYDIAFDQAVGHGFGFWSIKTEYNDDDSFDQDIKIRRISNSMRVYLDPFAQEVTKKDAMWGFITTLVDKEDYPDASWEVGIGEGQSMWFDNDKVRIAEYFRRVEIEIEIWKTPEGVIRVKDDTLDIRDELMSRGINPEQKRTAKTHKVEWYKLSANEVFEETVFPSKFIPIIPCYGKELNVNGETIYRGVIRYAKDPQRIYNYTRTASVEQVALAPKAPWVIEESQIGSHKNAWENANIKNYSMLPYKNKPGVPPPMRQAPPQPSSGWISESQIADQDIDSASGMYKASLGAPSNERSGKAINARKVEGDVGTYHYHDNRALSLQHTYEILVDMIPRVYDTARAVRIQTPDDNEEMININQEVFDRDSQQWIKIYDLSLGKYDVAVDVGASYTTQRQMASESMMELIQYAPQLAGQIIDLIAKNLDWPGADEIAERLKDNRPTMEQIQQQIQQQTQQAVQSALNGEQHQLDVFKAQTDRLSKIRKAENDDDALEVKLLELLEASDADVRSQVMQLINELNQEQQNNVPAMAPGIVVNENQRGGTPQGAPGVVINER